MNTSHYLAYDLAAIACTGAPTYYKSGKEWANTNDPVQIHLHAHGVFARVVRRRRRTTWHGGLLGADAARSKYLGGGFVWALLDDGVKRPDNGKMDVAGNQAPDGIVGPYLASEGGELKYNNQAGLVADQWYCCGAAAALRRR